MGKFAEHPVSKLLRIAAAKRHSSLRFNLQVLAPTLVLSPLDSMFWPLQLAVAGSESEILASSVYGEIANPVAALPLR